MFTMKGTTRYDILQVEELSTKRMTPPTNDVSLFQGQQQPSQQQKKSAHQRLMEEVNERNKRYLESIQAATYVSKQASKQASASFNSSID